MTLSLSVEDMIQEQAERHARDSFDGFMSYTMPHFTWGWFNEYLAGRLQRFYEDYEAGKNPRLMIFAPPRSGKSEQASRRFPAWLLGKDPKLKIIATSYASDLANRMSRDCQRIIESQAYHTIFPETNLNGRNVRTVSSQAIKTAELWEIINQKGKLSGGSYRSAGVNGSINGQGFGIGVIDDPTKNFRDASSKVYQTTTKEWYDSTFYTRRNPLKNGIILIMTRWHKQDLGGQLLEDMENGGDQWDIVKFPMEATHREVVMNNGERVIAREKGEILFPERMPAAFVKQCKKTALTWSALYQQNPTVAGGNFFKVEHWQYWTPESVANIVWKHKIITVDTAQKKGESNDYTVFQVWGYDGHRIYLLHQERGKWYSFELLKVAKKLWAEYGGGVVGPRVGASAFYIEDKVSGTGLIQELRDTTIPCIAVPRTIDKMTRAIDCHSYFESGFVVLPSHAHWLSDYLMEFEDFTLDDTHVHDDQVDPTLDAINILLKGFGGINYAGF